MLGGGEEGTGSDLSTCMYRVSLEEDKNTLKLDSDVGCVTL